MLIAIALLIAGVCVAASFRRLTFALTPTVLDLASLHIALRGDAARRRLPGLRAGIEKAARVPTGPRWEHAVMLAGGGPPLERVALFNEELQELDWRVQRWARVPRVCASIATSSGLMLATLAMREGLLVSSDLPTELRELAIHQAMVHAVDVVAIGLAGAAFCISVQLRARKAARERAEAADKLVERLEALALPAPSTAA